MIIILLSIVLGVSPTWGLVFFGLIFKNWPDPCRAPDVVLTHERLP